MRPDAGPDTWRCPACGAETSRPWLARSNRGGATSSSFVPSSDRFGSTLGALRRCDRCRHYAVAEAPAEEVFEGAYQDATDQISLREEEGQVRTSDRDLQAIEQHARPGRLLDVGCWTGSFLVAAARRGWSAEGIEPSAWARDRALARGCEVRGGMLGEVRLGGPHRLVVACDVVEHLVDPEGGLRTMGRALEPHGLLFLTVPDAGSRVARLLGRRWWSVLPMHVQYFNRRSMAALLDRTGFEVLSMSTHAKVFSARYYAERVEAFVPIVGRAAPTIVTRAGWGERSVAPDLRDRLAVIARRRD